MIRAAAVLENVSEEEKDWRPGSNNQVLDLVHPSLFCAVYGRTPSWSTSDGDRRLKPLEAPYEEMKDWAYSRKSSWIPTDFQLGQNGAPAKALDYINNVHPDKHKELVSVIESLVGRFSLLWDRVLTDIHPDNDSLLRREKVVGFYTWTNNPEYPLPTLGDRVRMGKDEFEKRRAAWQENRIFTPLTVDQLGYRGSGQDITRRETTYSIQGKIVQVIVKLANIHLVSRLRVSVHIARYLSY